MSRILDPISSNIKSVSQSLFRSIIEKKYANFLFTWAFNGEGSARKISHRIVTPGSAKKFYEMIRLTLIHGWSKTSDTDGRWSGLGESILRTKSLAVADIDFHSGVSSCEREGERQRQMIIKLNFRLSISFHPIFRVSLTLEKLCETRGGWRLRH